MSQLKWIEMLAFIYVRFRKHLRQKTQVQQWDNVGKQLKDLAETSSSQEVFIGLALKMMSVSI